MRSLLLILLLLPVAATAQQYDTVRVCTYNVLNFSNAANALDRIDEFRLILDEIKPHILLVQELANEEGKKMFGDSVAGRLERPLAPIGGSFRTTQDSYVWIYHDPAQFDPVRTVILEDAVRDQVGVILHHRSSGDSLVMLTMHWKAGDTPEDEARREESGRVILEQVRIARIFGGFSYILCGGDLNVYDADEQGYRFLLFELIDPIDRSGDWHDNADFADVHTQSPRARQFGGGVHGGMDDRFDQILLSPVLKNRYVPGSYTVFGNDGNHFNDSINAMPNTAVSPETAQALHDASDHLPVYLDLVFEKKTTSVENDAVWTERLLDLW